MELLLIWWATLAVGYGASLNLALRIIKDCADEGYKFSFKQLLKLNNNKEQNSIIWYLIPIVNFVTIINIENEYETNKYLAMYEMETTGLIKQMNLNEREKYKKKPNLLTVFTISLKSNNSKTVNNLDAKELNIDRSKKMKNDKEAKQTRKKIMNVKGKIIINASKKKLLYLAKGKKIKQQKKIAT